jgi:hypothetical protein
MVFNATFNDIWCIKLPSVFEGVLDTTLCDKVRQSLAAGW